MIIYRMSPRGDECITMIIFVVNSSQEKKVLDRVAAKMIQ